MPLSLAARLKIKANDIFQRITLNRITTIFFLFTFAQCFGQAIMHSFLFSTDGQYYGFLKSISVVSSLSKSKGNFTYPTSYMRKGNLTLRMCNDVDLYHPENNCSVVFDYATDVKPVVDITQNSILRGQTVLSLVSGSGGRMVVATPGTDTFTDALPPPTSKTYDESIKPVELEGQDGNKVLLNQQCIQILSYPKQQ